MEEEMDKGNKCSRTQVLKHKTKTFINHSHNQIKDKHTDVLTW
jgi:hypothetical protein